tara:strand:- start:34 stop:579 length:546 start_codon:yes stop_codon:yes gene_type:complete
MEYLMKSPQKDDQQDDRLLFGIVLYDTKEKKSQIEKAIENLLEIDYPETRLKIVINSYLSKNKKLDHYVNHANLLLNKFKHTRLLLNHQLELTSDVDYNAFIICRNANYLIKMRHDQTIKPDFLRSINRVYQKNLVVKHNDVVAIPRSLVSKNYLDFNDYDKMSQYLLEQADNNNSLKNIE